MRPSAGIPVCQTASPVLFPRTDAGDAAAGLEFQLCLQQRSVGRHDRTEGHDSSERRVKRAVQSHPRQIGLIRLDKMQVKPERKTAMKSSLQISLHFNSKAVQSCCETKSEM